MTAVRVPGDGRRPYCASPVFPSVPLPADANGRRTSAPKMRIFATRNEIQSTTVVQTHLMGFLRSALRLLSATGRRDASLFPLPAS